MARGGDRVGSRMSTRQMAYAAVNGRLVRFHFLRGQGNKMITGYIVGMDDYHVLVAEVVRDHNDLPEGVRTTLITKGRVDYMGLDGEDSLSEEPEVVRKAVHDVGDAFFEHCKEHHFGKQSATTSEEPAR